MVVGRWILVVSMVLASASAKAVIKESTPIPGIKKVWIYGDTINPSSVTIILSGDGGWVLGVVDLANHLARENALVIGVNCKRYLHYLKKQDVSCYSSSDDIEKLGIFIQKKYHITYLKPIIIGYSLGATLAYGVLAQAQGGTFKGAISLGFCYDLDMPRPLCGGAGLESRKRTKKGYDLLPTKHLTDPFVIIQGTKDKECQFCMAKDFANQTEDAIIVELQHVKHGGLGLRRWMPAILEVYRKMTGYCSNL